MNLPISDRLLACAGFVNPGDRVADVGCDHGYLGIYLLKRNIARSVIASDLRKGPLQSAKDNGALYGVADRMEFYLSDGLKNVPHDFDTMVCAGMGAETMISILEAAPWLQQEGYRLILQCQIKNCLLRRWLSENHFRILNEQILRDGKFLYTVLEAVYDLKATALTPGQWYIPPVMPEAPEALFPEYFFWTKGGLHKIVVSRGENAPDWMAQADRELEEMAEQPLLKEYKEKHHEGQ